MTELFEMPSLVSYRHPSFLRPAHGKKLSNLLGRHELIGAYHQSPQGQQYFAFTHVSPVLEEESIDLGSMCRGHNSMNEAPMGFASRRDINRLLKRQEAIAVAMYACLLSLKCQQRRVCLQWTGSRYYLQFSASAAVCF